MSVWRPFYFLFTLHIKHTHEYNNSHQLRRWQRDGATEMLAYTLPSVSNQSSNAVCKCVRAPASALQSKSTAQITLQEQQQLKRRSSNAKLDWRKCKFECNMCIDSRGGNSNHSGTLPTLVYAVMPRHATTTALVLLRTLHFGNAIVVAGALTFRV